MAGEGGETAVRDGSESRRRSDHIFPPQTQIRENKPEEAEQSYKPPKPAPRDRLSPARQHLLKVLKSEL